MAFSPALPSAAAVSAFLSIVLCCAGLSSAADDSSFCQGLVASLSQCPAVPTVDTVDISKYTGRWYEIGTNAQFAFSLFGQQGGQCVTANYTNLGPVDGKVNIKVVNHALGVTTVLRSSQSLGISLSAGASGLGVRALCQFLVGNLPLSVAIPGLGTAASALASNPLASRVALNLVTSLATLNSALLTLPNSVSTFSSTIKTLAASNVFLSAAAKATISAELGKINAAQDAASTQAQQVFAAIEEIQTSNFVLSGSTLPATYSLATTLADIQTQTAAIQGLKDQIVANRAQILTSAQTIQLAVGFRAPGITAAAAGLQLLTQGQGPLGLALEGIGAGATAVSATAKTVTAETLQSRVISATGNAVQNPAQKGALTVSFFGSAGGPYNIIKLDGSASTGYDTALVYSCSADITSAFVPQNGVFLLSRTPTVPQSTLDAALAFIKQKGIFLGGDNAFVTVVQDATLCKPITSLP